MVSNEEIKKNLDLKRKGIDPYDPNLKDKFCPKCGTKNSFTSDFCLECGQQTIIIL